MSVASVYAVGDVGPRRDDPDYPFRQPIFELSAPVAKQADVVFCQLERILSDRPNRLYYPDITHPNNVRQLVAGGFNAISVAGNHHMDAGVEAFVDTLDVLKANNIKPVGGGMNIEEARSPAMFDCKGTRVALLAYSSILSKGEIPYHAEADRPGCAPMYVSTFYEARDWQPGTPTPRVISLADEDDLSAMKDDVKRAKEQADVLVMSFHWGVHHVPGLIARYQYEVGRAAIDAGADLVVGSHPHILKGIEVYRGKVIFYSLANFAMDAAVPRARSVPGRWDAAFRPKSKSDPKALPYHFPPDHDARKTIMAKCIIEDRKVRQVTFQPFMINQLGQPEPLNAGDKRSDAVLDYVKWCCQDQKLSTEFARDGNDIIVCT